MIFLYYPVGESSTSYSAAREVKIETMKKEISWLIFYLTEGKNREIRNICKFYKLKINKLIRIQFGKYKILDTKPGEIKEIYNPSL